MEDRSLAAVLLGLTYTNYLVTFDSAAPTKITRSVKISGLGTGEDLVSLDARPADGVIFGVSTKNLLYRVSPSNGVATIVGAGPASFDLNGKFAAVDFNPSVDRLRVVTPTDQNFRINQTTGGIVDGDGATPGVQPDTALAYAAGDPNNLKNPNLAAIAYDRNFQGATQTTLYGIDSFTDSLAMVGGVNGAPSPNGGLLNTVGGLGGNFGPRAGFDITAAGTAYASLVTNNGAGFDQLYTVNLTTGAVTLVGRIGNGKMFLDALTELPRQEFVYGVTQTSNRLVSFAASDPSRILTVVPLRNLMAGETVTGIDFRPATGELFGLTSMNRMIRIDTATGVTTQVGSTIVTTPQYGAGSPAGFDFNPAVDRLRLVNAANDNLRYNPVSFSPVDSDGNGANGNTPDTSLAFDAGDANAGADPNIVGSAYDRNDNDGATATTLFGIDSNLNIVVRQGGVDGTPSPNVGLLFTLGSLGVDVTNQVGFDISDNGTLGRGAALAVMQVQGETFSRLFQINLSGSLTNQPLGQATSIGRVGVGEVLSAMAIAPPTIQFAAKTVSVSERAGNATIVLTRTGGSGGTATVRLDTIDGTALSGADYTAIENQIVTFKPGETQKTVTVTLANETLRETTETVLLTLSSITGGDTMLGVDAVSILNILNDDR